MKFFSTILDALSHHALETPNKVAFAWVDIKCEEQNKMTFKQLEDQSNAVAARLLKLGCQEGDRVMIAYPFGLEFLTGMFGAMKVGVIPCSIYPPNPNQLKTDIPKFRGFAKDAGAKYALSTNMFATAMTAASVLYKTGVKWIGTDNLPIKKRKRNKTKDYEKFEGEPNEVCFIQYTSGSTGRPKGVMITHHNLAENCRAIGTSTQMTSTSVTVSWVPQYHDMGLVGGFMSCLYSGALLVMTSPLDFLSKPVLWSDMIETFQATHTCAPNFAYALLLKRLKKSNRTADWSCLKFAGFGAEPTQQSVVEDVVETLSVEPGNVHNLYGLAESVVWLTNGPAIADSEGLVCCGEVTSPTLKLRIVQDGKEVGDGQVGSIWAQSPRVAAGYYGQPELTTSTFANALPQYDGTWLDTGDLGKVVDGQLYVTGRVKDVIIINGKNYYPTDVELSIDDLFGDLIRPGRTTAFQHGEDSVGITVEGRKDFDKSGNEDLTVQIANHVSQVHGLFSSEVVVLKLGVTPKTTSGKLKRSEIRLTTVGGDWKESSILLQFKRQETVTPLQKSQRSSFLERSFSMRGIASNEFYLDEETEHEIMRQSVSTGNWNFEQLPGIDLSQTNALPSKAADLRLYDTAVAGALGPDDFSSRYANTIASVFGYKVALSKSWAENGLTSLNSAELRNKVEEQLHVALPANFAQLYPTPKELEEFLASSEGQHFPTKSADEHVNFHWNNPRSQCSKLEMSLVQGLGFIPITLVLLASIFPYYLVAAKLSSKCSISEDQECLKTSFLWFPLLFPLFCLSFSIMVVLCKILVVGVYRHQAINLMSRHYLKWWFVDRLMHVWELFVGRFLLETKFAWLFYWLLGADIAWSTKIDAFIRECDLVSVGANSSVGHAIRCRKFRPWTEGSPRMVFRPITVGPNCKVSGMLSPGAVIGAGSIVEKLTVVEEGAQVPDGVIARGIPAHKAGSCNRLEANWWNETLLDAFKVFWMFSEAYHYYALYFLAHAILKEILPIWRYQAILHWFLLFPLASLIAMVTSILLKWLLIGKRDPSKEYGGTLWRRATNWACDYHFRIAAWMLGKFMGGSRFETLALWCHGLDVDAVSILHTASMIFSPSKVDFVKIRQSFLALTEIELDIPSASGEKIEISHSSLGRDTIVHAGAKVVRSKIPSRSQVSDKIYDLNPPKTQLIVSWSFILLEVILPEVALLVMIAIIFWSIIPAFELASAVPGSNSSPSVLILIIVGAVAFQFLVWILLARILEWAFLNVLPPSIQNGFFRVYISYMNGFRYGNPIEVFLMGTLFFKHYVLFMGAEVDGDLWFFDCTLDEFGNYHFEGNTIMDNAYPRGHYVDINGLKLDDVYISGVIHPGCYIAGGAVVEGRENGPLKSFFPSTADTKPRCEWSYDEEE
ncbi:D-alanine--D-alanyl carrier protein ligase [Seminavis robusta]|uniref:D-alanine--D-alanyl carrier protein ligase n=1 Tax=Seminavis robusta TaxID=568900 RepID=A0A9N8EYL3_9STRA|nr:D-alanine--D-alanyl carrier protein ligase [Seminavis robusta]|eukprot:Sro1989_g309690.1 D-alanine--D-alanyl carrier protein ligase (1401) ;mRNA; f:2394-6675